MTKKQIKTGFNRLAVLGAVVGGAGWFLRVLDAYEDLNVGQALWLIVIVGALLPYCVIRLLGWGVCGFFKEEETEE